MITVRLPLLLLASDGDQYKKSELYIEDFAQVSSTLFNELKLKCSDFYLSKCSENVYHVKLRLLGGKGGFGSQLRAQGNKMSSKKRAGNYESCRSLNGQRLRVQKQTKMIEEYLAKEPERLSKREQEIREKMQKYLEAPDKKVMFSDPEYLKLCRKLIDSTEDAVRSGLRAKNEDFDSENDEDEDEDEEDYEDDPEESEVESNDANEPELESKEPEILESEDEKSPAPVPKCKNDRITSKYLDKYLKK